MKHINTYFYGLNLLFMYSTHSYCMETSQDLPKDIPIHSKRCVQKNVTFNLEKNIIVEIEHRDEEILTPPAAFDSCMEAIYMGLEEIKHTHQSISTRNWDTYSARMQSLEGLVAEISLKLLQKRAPLLRILLQELDICKRNIPTETSARERLSIEKELRAYKKFCIFFLDGYNEQQALCQQELKEVAAALSACTLNDRHNTF